MPEHMAGKPAPLVPKNCQPHRRLSKCIQPISRRTRMFSHVMIGSNDLARSQRFYDAVLGVLGAKGGPQRNTSPTGHERLFYAHDRGMLCITQPIDDQPATVANGATLGFKCSSPEQVKAFHDVAVAHGGTSIEDPPGVRENSVGTLYLAYVRDPDGHKLCALHRVAKP
jgi:catechol 2,3-dioxygenase-like lactoylglutathione lyase family enzyme